MDPMSLLQLGFSLIKAVGPHAAGFATEELSYLVCYEKKLEELDKAVEKLRGQKKRVDDKVVEEEGRYGREIYEDVLVWLGQVRTVLSEYDKFKEEEERKHAWCCLGHPPLNPRLWYDFCQRIKEIRKKVEQLLPEKHDIISRWQGVPSMGDAFSNADYESFVSRTQTMNDIMKALKDPRTRMIGVHGLSGVGKTTLVIEAAKKAKEEKVFNVVIMANVTKSPDIRKIQGQIADMLGMKLEEESEHARSIRIQEKLKKGKDNTLIILDDLWAKVDLHMLGIPSMSRDDGNGGENNLIPKEDKSSATGAQSKMETEQSHAANAKQIENPSVVVPSSKTTGKTEEHYKYKILLISEARQVLVKQMEGKENSIFPVDVISGKDAENLFKKAAGVGPKNSELGKLAAQIAKRCYGLPMSIVTTAKALKDQSRSVWEDTLRMLEGQNLTGTPEYSTKLSYQLLESDELKMTFLLCARMGHDALVADLVKYCIGLSFLQGVYTVMETRDRVQTLLAKLKQSGLLSDSYSSDHFTMQNLVRNAALSIASQENHVFVLTKGKLFEWPDEDKLERYTVISLRHCDIIEEFPKNIRCPRLKVFHVDNNDSHLKIPGNIFQEMKELRVLILNGINLSPLPPSIEFLTKLRMLCLEKCTLDGEELRLIGELKNLRILRLSRSDIKSLPSQLKHLSKLQIFDISNCSKLELIPSSVISSLTSLEELHMRNTLVQWRVDKGKEGHDKNVSLSELGNLHQLKDLDIQIPSADCVPDDLFFDNLHSYKIVIGSLSSRYLEQDFKIPENYELSRFLAIQQKDLKIHAKKGIKMLFERVEILLLEKLNGIEDLFHALNLKGFPYLQNLSIVSCSDIQSLINPKDRVCPEKTFPKLESLYLYKLKKMEEICISSCQLLEPSFGKLKTIKIELCNKLKNVFLFSVAKLLISLEAIHVSGCNSLEKIVHRETQNNDKVEDLVFPKLRSLTLRSLPKLTGFYPISLTPETTIRILFQEKVKVSELERMELSSLQIEHIWIDKFSHFENLIHLDVDDCWNIKDLFSFSMAKNLLQLQSLSVSECEKMEHIFFQLDANVKDKIFPNLKNIKLSRMKSLIAIWSCKVPAGSFGKLDTLIIDKCDKLVNVFSGDMAEIFQSISSLRVTNCWSMKAIFDSKRGFSIKLQELHLITLPKLENVLKWENGQEGILDLKNLIKIGVQNCNRLKNILPFSVAKALPNLEYLTVRDCFQLTEIVADGYDVNSGSSNSPFQFVFPKLIGVKFLQLPNVKHFYPRAYELSCPRLNNLSLDRCDKLKLFREETADAHRTHVLFSKEVINNLKSMEIQSQHAKSSAHHYYRRDNLEELHLSTLTNSDIEILYYFLHHNPSLKNLCLSNCFFNELVPLKRRDEIESLGVVPKLKSLKLTNLNYLKNIGFERDAVLQRIESLILTNCPWLKTVAPASVSFFHLTSLEVDNCTRLEYLMSLSTAKSLGQLNTMKVINCNSLKEIVLEQPGEAASIAERESGGGENAGKVKIVFRQLKSLELLSMENLKCFCSSFSFLLEFPSLEKIVVSACPKMEDFSPKVKSTPVLQKIYAIHEDKRKRWWWEGDLQATIQYMFKNKKYFVGMDRLSVSEHLDLQQVWQGKEDLQKDWFYSLKTLTLKNCKLGEYAIPSNVLRCLKSLKELTVSGCNNIRGIFEMDDNKIWGTPFQLKKLTLSMLPDVTHVWQQGKRGTSRFHNLQLVTVDGCGELKTLFPVSLAINLKKLEKLVVMLCLRLLEIVGKEGGEAGGTEEFVFPHLTHLKLVTLPRLTDFYSESFILECPELKLFIVTHCYNLKLFQPREVSHPQNQVSTSTVRQALFSDIKGISNVESCFLYWKDTSVLQSWFQGQSTIQDLQHLNELQLCFDDDDDVKENYGLLFEILDKTPNLERMCIWNGRSLKELFSSQHPHPKSVNLGNLKRLYMYTPFELHSLGGWLDYLTNLHTLYVFGSPSLTRIVQSCSNLRELYIIGCRGLKRLLTPSEANMLMHLEKLHVSECESMEEIIAGKEQDVAETGTQEIKFEGLESIVLNDLSRLECFYAGDSTLRLNSRVQVRIVKCSNMKIFSRGPIHVESCSGIQVKYDWNYGLVLQDDLNDAVERQFLYQTKLILGDYPGLQEKWLGSVAIPSNWSFGRLKFLEVEGCKFLSDVVIPSHLFPYLKNLKNLLVRKCDSVEAVFDVKDTSPYDHDSSIIDVHLITLNLEQLPSLKYVWKQDPKGILNFPSLEKVSVKECKSIKHVFPASITQDNLRTLTVKNCLELTEIVAKDDATTKVAQKEAMFSRVTSLTLWDLPNLKCICSGMHILDWSVLDDFDVIGCPMLRIFTIDSQHSPDSDPEKQDHICHQGLISAEKVTSQLEILSLKKEDIILIEQGLLHVDLQKLKYLKLHNFNDKSETFPDTFFSKVPLPNVDTLMVANSAFTELFLSEKPDTDYSNILSQVKIFELKSLLKLQSIGLEQTRMAPLLENLEHLFVYECNSLTNLAPSTVSLSHLTYLNIEDCAKLKHLFTSSTPKSLVALNSWYITNCESLETIVATEEGNKPDEDVVFRSLKTLSLTKLPKLGSFYTGNSIMSFPMLDNISFTECKSMKTFSNGIVIPKTMWGKIDEVHWYGNVNTAVHQHFEKGSSSELA